MRQNPLGTVAQQFLPRMFNPTRIAEILEESNIK